MHGKTEASETARLGSWSPNVPIIRKFKGATNGRPTRLYAFDNFRAIAIVLIVVGHSYGHWAINTLEEKFIASLITGATSLFVFISGFFFHHTFYPKFAWGPFLHTKLVNVGVPYLVLTAIYCAVVTLGYFGQVPIQDFSRWPGGGIADFVLIYFQYVITGRSLGSYWYVPFILLMFAASPLFIRFIKMTLLAQLAVLGSAVLVSVLVHRPMYNENPFHSALCFTSVYLLGILTSAYKAEVFAFIKRYAVGIGILLALVTLLKVLVDGHHNSLHKAGIFTFDGIDVFILQKYLQIALMLSLLLRFANRRIPVLQYVAERSFAIFFIHNWLGDLPPWALLSTATPGFSNFYVFLIKAVLTFLTSIAIADILRAILKYRSRYLIGY